MVSAPPLFLNYAENLIHQFDMAMILDAGLDHLSSVASLVEYVSGALVTHRKVPMVLFPSWLSFISLDFTDDSS